MLKSIADLCLLKARAFPFQFRRRRPAPRCAAPAATLAAGARHHACSWVALYFVVIIIVVASSTGAPSTRLFRRVVWSQVRRVWPRACNRSLHVSRALIGLALGCRRPPRAPVAVAAAVSPFAVIHPCLESLRRSCNHSASPCLQTTISMTRIQHLVRNLQRGSAVQRARAAAELRDLARAGPHNCVAIAAAGGIPGLVRLLSNAHGQTMMCALEALGRLAEVSPECCTAIIAAGGWRYHCSGRHPATGAPPGRRQ